MDNKRKKICRSKSLGEKYEIICFLRDNPSYKQKMICEKFDIKQSTLATYMQQKETIIEGYNDYSKSLKIKRSRKPNFNEVDEALLIWFSQKRQSNLCIDGKTLQLKATEFASAFGYENTEISSAWIDRWKIRHNISSKVLSGEKSSVDEVLVNDWKNQRLPDALKNWAPEDIYNVDETALFWKLTPNRTLCFKNEKLHGDKKSKDRVTILVGASLSGEKLPLLAIGRFEKPRCFRGVHNLPVKYRANRKSWMTGRIFEEWVRNLDKNLSRKILLVLDNCTAHTKVADLRNINFLFLPANTTSSTQPMDCGIIKNLKDIYKRKLAIKLLKAHDENVDFQFNLLDSLSLLNESWKNVSDNTIRNCFHSAGFFESSDVVNNLVQIDNDISEFEPIYKRVCSVFLISAELDINTYLNLDNSVETSGSFRTDEIVGLVNTSPEDIEQDEELEPFQISSKDGLLAARTLQQYIRQHPLASDAHCEMTQHLVSFIESESVTQLKQTKITDFFNE